MSPQQFSLRAGRYKDDLVRDHWLTATSRTNLPLAVKCGGHHAGGASAVDNGLVIDLSHLKGVEINKERSEVTVAGGCLWGEVYTALRKEGLACVGGGVHNVGIGGHLLGGM